MRETNLAQAARAIALAARNLEKAASTRDLTLAQYRVLAPKRQGWIRRLVGYMKPHKKNAYIAFGVAAGGQLIQSFLPVVQKVIVDDVITEHTKPLAPWLTLMIVMGVATFILAYFRRF